MYYPPKKINLKGFKNLIEQNFDHENSRNMKKNYSGIGFRNRFIY
jgi:hypothetical protein